MITVAIIGAGRMGKVHGGNAARHPDVKVKYVIDPVAASAQPLAKSLGAEVTSIETALADKEVNAVIITSPTPTHFDFITQSAKAGKAVFTEKPVDLNLERVNAALKVVADAKVPFMVGFQRRWDPTFRAMKKQVEAGAIGTVEMVRVTSRDPYPPPPSYVQGSGGLFRDMMIHDFDIARWFLGEEPNEVFATGSCLVDPEIGKLKDYDSAVCVLKTPSGKLAHIENSRRAAYGYDQRLEVFGSKGALQAANHSPAAFSHWSENGITHQKPHAFFPERYVEAYAVEIAHFIDALVKGTPPEVGGEAGRGSLALGDAATKSAETKTVVRLG
ncbi:MAG: inositol 2-dehydrogenase [Myxococcaceae bacterium]|nr:inositol 2-dehydrogenase [Myxococcaceae bacterium]